VGGQAAAALFSNFYISIFLKLVRKVVIVVIVVGRRHTAQRFQRYHRKKKVVIADDSGDSAVIVRQSEGRHGAIALTRCHRERPYKPLTRLPRLRVSQAI